MNPNTQQRTYPLSNDQERYLFSHFLDVLEQSKSFNREEKEYILSLFEHKKVQKTLGIVVILLFWSLVAPIIEVSLVGRGLTVSILHGFDVFNFLPNIAFVFANGIIKYWFISWYDRNDHYFTSAQKWIMTIPFAGAFLFLSTVFKKEPLLEQSIVEFYHVFKKRNIKTLLGFWSK